MTRQKEDREEHKMRLLIADDEQFIWRGLLSLNWKSIGITEVYSANNGTKAKEILLSEPVDIAILDIRMPGATGLDLADMIQNLSMPTKVVLLTGFSENYLSRKIRQETGYSFTDILLALRLMSAVRHLYEGEKVSAAAEASGFNDQHYFAQVFRRVFKVSPSDWKKQENSPEVLHFHEVLSKVVEEKNPGTQQESK